MKEFILDKKKYWVGIHIKIGILIFDKNVQKNLEQDRVRLFNVKEGKMLVFSKESVKKRLREISLTDDSSVTSAVKNYHSLKVSTRATHCFGCRRDLNTVDFYVCNVCGWISCVCGSCGCNYRTIA